MILNDTITLEEYYFKKPEVKTSEVPIQSIKIRTKSVASPRLSA